MVQIDTRRIGSVFGTLVRGIDPASGLPERKELRPIDLDETGPPAAACASSITSRRRLWLSA
jgi:hypothetical protein